MSEYIKETEKKILEYENKSKIHWLRGEDDEFVRLLGLIFKAKAELAIAKEEQIV